MISIGFKPYEDSEPEFKYVQPHITYTIKDLSKKLNLNNFKSEEDFEKFLLEKKIYRLYDCGKRKFVLQKI